jgi:hypothetical protein
MIKKHLLCGLIILLSIANVKASECVYQNKDLTSSLSQLDDVISVASETQVPHPTRGVPLKHVVIFQGGDIAIIEQNVCVIFNLSINMLAAEDTSEKVIVKRLSNILQVTPVFSKHFKNTNFNHDISINIKDNNFTLSQNSSFKISLTDRIPSETAITEMSLVYTPNDGDGYELYNRSIIFYLGAGMHN